MAPQASCPFFTGEQIQPQLFTDAPACDVTFNFHAVLYYAAAHAAQLKPMQLIIL
jgi:hypothetical protein